jgi:hypothetical protein
MQQSRPHLRGRDLLEVARECRRRPQLGSPLRQGILTDVRRPLKLRVIGQGRELKLRLVGDWERTPLEGLCETARAAAALTKLQHSLVFSARGSGRSWAEIGGALGISKQAAWERFADTIEAP